jgi:hypothetical protein
MRKWWVLWIDRKLNGQQGPGFQRVATLRNLFRDRLENVLFWFEDRLVDLSNYCYKLNCKIKREYKNSED